MVQWCSIADQQSKVSSVVNRKLRLDVKITHKTKSLFWYHLQENSIRDRVLLPAISDGRRASAGQSDRRLGQSSWQPGLWIHRRSHSPAHWAPVEHHQVTTKRQIWCLIREGVPGAAVWANYNQALQWSPSLIKKEAQLLTCGYSAFPNVFN